MTQAQRDIKRKMKVLEHARECGNVAKTCRYFGISRQCYYNWLHAFERRGEGGLVDSRPCPENHKLRTPKPIEDKIVHLRLTYHFGPHRIAWYLERYLGISISPHGVYNVLARNGINRLPVNCRQRSMPSVIRYEKQVPGHHVQVNVKFLDLIGPEGRKIRRFQAVGASWLRSDASRGRSGHTARNPYLTIPCRIPANDVAAARQFSLVSNSSRAERARLL